MASNKDEQTQITLVTKKDSDFELIVKDLIAGTVGGIALVIVGHPLDTLKVRLQTQSSVNPLYSGMVDCLKKTIAQEGLGGLYKGVASPLIGQAFFNAAQFMAYGQAKLLIAGNEKRQLTIGESFLAGAMTGLAVSFVESPIDLFKSQMQVQVFRTPPPSSTVGAATATTTTLSTPVFKNVFQCASFIGKNYGIRGVFQGLIPTFARDVPAISLYFGVYEAARLALTPPGGRVEDLPASSVLIAGGCGGFAYWSLTYPIDVVKSSIQADAIDPKQRQFKGFWDTTRKLYADGGYRRFFRGLTPCLLRAFPGNAACFFAYEKTRQLLGA
jgi:solute carrier family 25 carnitine/acylcarnitine transporter 20/29